MEYHSKLFLFLNEELNNISLVKSIMHKLASLYRVYLCDYKNEEIGEFYDVITSVIPLKVYTKEDLNIALYNRKNKGVHSLYCRLEIINLLPKYYNFVLERTIDVGNGYCLCIVNPKDNIYEESDEIEIRIAYALRILNINMPNCFTVDKNSIQTIKNGLHFWHEQGLINDEYKISYDYIDKIKKRADLLTAIKVSLEKFISCKIPPKPFLEFIGYLLGAPLPKDTKKYYSWTSSWNKVNNK